MNVVLSSRGSRGDVYPIIEIGAALKRAGCKVSICVPEMFGPRARSKGLKPLLYSEDSAMVMQELGSGIGAIRTAIDWFSRAIDEQIEFLIGETEGADMLVTSVNEVAVPTVAEYRGIPHYRIAYTPVLPGYHPPPLIPWQKLPAIANKGLWSAVNFGTGLMFRKHINKYRGKLGMADIGGVNSYFTGRSHTVLTINPVLAPPCRSWSKNYDFSYTGYCYGDIDGGLSPDLVRFLEDGPPPVYIGFGSVSVDDSDSFTGLILDAVKRARCRAVLGTGWTGLGKTELPPEIFPVGDTNHATLFSLCAGVAHHGGCGTTHTAARAGVPQFIMPQIADQFYWGHRIHTLGLGPAPVPPKRITVKKLALALSELANNRFMAKNAAALGVEMKDENGIPGVVDIVTGRAVDTELYAGVGGAKA
ncbi:MAG: glycosyltransferase family 1 protein [Spirochaetes bacterium]|nr:glycosyltransferase family 1 protein [Spirochaetota bacterium]